ncbi:hypothetical protein AGDE_14748 [Angomonas deanei]|nr:hypothetical protein AGDE_14748 [Angomonas deanei]|eukprot:EPY20305.1 hypothetical protein AGDE_14748 [Angomonas deanei]
MLSGLDAKTVQSLLEEEDVDAYTLNRVAEQTGGVSLFGNMPTAVPLHQRAKSRVVPRSLYTVAALNDELRQVASQVNRTSKHPVTAKPPSSHFVDPVNVPSSPVLHHTNVSIDSTDLQDYLSFLSSGDWEVRLLALERVLHLFSTGELHFPLPDVLTQEIVKRLLDSHFQILRVSLKLSGLFMKKHLESVTLLLPDYLYALLTNSVHAKHDIQQVACLQLKYLVDHVSPGEMEAALQPAIGSGHTPLIRQRSLEVLQFLFQMQPKFFSEQLAMLRVLKLLVFLARGEKYNSAVWTSLLCAVTSLYVVNQRSFLTSVVHLPSEDQSFVKELLKSAVPQLNSDLNTLVKGRTTTLTNPLEVKVPETTFSRIIASRFARKYEEDYFSSPKVIASPVKRDHGRVPSENIPLKERPAFFRERRNRPIQASAFDSSLSSRACGVARTNADEPWEGEAQATQDVPSARWCLDQLRGSYSAQEKCTQLTCLEQILWDPKKWGEGCESSFVQIIDRLGKDSTEPNHNVRELAFVCLRSFASVRAMHNAWAVTCTRL